MQISPIARGSDDRAARQWGTESPWFARSYDPAQAVQDRRAGKNQHAARVAGTQFHLSVETDLHPGLRRAALLKLPASDQTTSFHISRQSAWRSYARNPASIRNPPFGTPAEPIAEPIASRLIALYPFQNPPLPKESIRVRNSGQLRLES